MLYIIIVFPGRGRGSGAPQRLDQETQTFSAILEQKIVLFFGNFPV